MTSQRSPAARALKHLLKSLGVVTRWSLQKVLSILLKLWRLFDSIRSKRTLDPDNLLTEPREQPLHSDTRNGLVCASSLPTLSPVEQHPLETTLPTTASEFFHETDLSELGFKDDFFDGVSSVPNVPTPLPNTLAPLNHGPPSRKTPEIKLVPVHPREYDRYSRARLEIKETDRYIIRPLQHSFSSSTGPHVSELDSNTTLHSRSELLHDWTCHSHPEGALYFCKENQVLRILTDFYIYDDEEYQLAEKAIKEITKYISKHQIVLPEDTELVLEPRKSGNVGYYLADPLNKAIFWLKETDIAWELKEVKVEIMGSHVGHLFHSWYWFHNELFPHARKLPLGVIDEVSDILTHAIGDYLTSSVCLLPYSLDALKHMLDLTCKIKEQQHTEHWIGSACILYRFMSTFDEQRFLNLHGQKGARLSLNQSIHPETAQTYFFKVFSILFLSAPATYLKKLQEISVDSMVNKPSWSKLKERLTGEWKDLVFFATVLLNANVAFLAIQSVDQQKRSYAQRFSYFSVLTSMGAIIFGLLLTRQHQHIFNMSFLANRGASPLGFETLALMYSLPYVFGMWGTFSFLAAFSAMCYSSNDSLTYVLMSAGWFTIFLLLLWCISTSFETDAYFHLLPIRVWKYLTQKYQEWRRQTTDIEVVRELEHPDILVHLYI